MKISVCICTWNRCRLLRNTLDHFQHLKIPADVQWELIVVDNGSDDDTPGVIADFQKQLPIRSFIESTPGHCAARNRAVDQFDGDVVLWTDDDVEVDRQWLESYANVVSSDNTNSFWGGPIEAKFESPAPSWITENWDILSGCFAVRNIGDTPLAFQHDLLPYGANFAVRGDIQKQYRFDTNVGRNRQQVVGGDEINLMQRLLADDLQGQWVPDAKVLHIIPDERATEEYVYQYFVGQGRILARSKRAFDRIGHYLFKILYDVRYRWARNKSPSRQWLSHMINAALHDGKMAKK